MQRIVGEARADDHQRAALELALGVGELVASVDHAAARTRSRASERMQRDPRGGERAMNLRLLVAHDGPGAEA